MVPKTYEFRKAVAEYINQVGGLYHQIDLGDGLIIKGEYDLSKVLHHYNLPADLSGKTVLDIGTAAGFFALECTKRGADVTAIDLWPPYTLNELKRALGIEFKYVQKSIYDLDACFGKFDLVICGSLLLHLRDIFGAIQKIREVCTGEAIISTAASNYPQCAEVACCEFIGAHNGEWAYWGVNAAGLGKMLLVSGFSSVSEPRYFTLRSEPGWHDYAVPHIVMSAKII